MPPDDLKHLINAKATPAEAATCFLDRMIGSAMESGNNETFNLLITVMETSDDAILNNLAQDIKKENKGRLRNVPVIGN